MSNNPLTQYFRQPAVYVKLPSGGKYYSEGSIVMPANQELPVYPMTAIDEIAYKTGLPIKFAGKIHAETTKIAGT